MNSREYWLDYLRAFACILVTVGHLIMSFQEAHILQDNLAASMLIDLIYCFHVYIFFFCSGYLFQKIRGNALHTKRTYIYQIERCIDFLILYVLFSGVTYAVKVIFSSNVNNAVAYGFFETLTKHPINQMWYLYAISTIYFFAHLIKSQKTAVAVALFAVLLRILIGVPAVASVVPIPLSYLCQNAIWFVIGQLFAYKQIELTRNASVLLALLFSALFVLRSIFDVNLDILNAMLTFLGVVASAGIIRCMTKNIGEIRGIWKCISKYMLQIYLLHTIFAAGIRIVLLKMGNTNIWVHLIFGLLFSFMMPVVCAITAERIKILNVFFFPIKTMKGLLPEKSPNKMA